MEPSSLIAVGASAGGVEALREFVAGLPPDMTAAVLIVLHLPPGGFSALPAILGRACALPVQAAGDGIEAMPGHIYTAVPDTHLLVRDGRMVLSHGPTENGHRPGVDATFRSAAMVYGPRAAGVVLSGGLDDGSAGLALIKRMGGLTAVQDPKEAMHPGMPNSAMRQVDVDLVLPARAIGDALVTALRHRVSARPPPSELDRLENAIDAGHRIERNGVADMTIPSGLTCPDCSGSLYDLGDGRYRCRVGHAWSPEALLIEQGTEVERALWAALRALQEKQQLADKMCADAGRFGDTRLSARFAAQSAEQLSAAKILRKLLVGDGDKGPG